MPIARLYVEGKLETEILNCVFNGTPVLVQGGSKYALKPRARTDRQENKIEAGYLRDRDFDHDPPDDLTTPTVDCEDSGTPIGWRWCRHELENYLIDPVIVTVALGWSAETVYEVLCTSARHIRLYEAARWTVGRARRALPPHYDLKTRPENLPEIAVPSLLDHATLEEWATSIIEEHRTRIDDKLANETAHTSFNELVNRFDNDFVSDVSKILFWFSGKDLMAGMAAWLAEQGYASPKAFRTALRDWISANPDRVLELLPEWKSLIEVLRK